MSAAPWTYILLCIAVPCAVGGAMYAIFEVWDRVRRRRRAEDALPHVDYLI